MITKRENKVLSSTELIPDVRDFLFCHLIIISIPVIIHILLISIFLRFDNLRKFIGSTTEISYNERFHMITERE